ncbi:sulfite exporter TauE/SafE family protein [Psychrobacter immobilis]|uniref:sulfite exporter TauE/SafE family protein n=1 Tax=Psychrobacter immobilis TaxID=498 RepID=UPI001D130358|nr:sulfite exporter TauE/SafE family protein [Psychrobacter immobilis]
MSTVLDLLQTIPTWHLIGLFVAGMLAFIISIISGGGGAILLIPVTSWMIGATAAPPVINLATFMSNGSRMYLFWHDIDWSLTKYYVPSALVGAWLAALIFSRLDAGWIQLLIGVFLVSTIFQYKFGKVSKTFDMPKVGFMPLGFIIGFMSTLVGGLGPILNPFYMNAGLEKENLIATKTANSFFVGIVQMISYTFFGIITAKLLVYGLVLGLGAVIGNIIGKRFLAGMSISQFRIMLLILMVISGLIMIIRNVNVIF